MADIKAVSGVGSIDLQSQSLHNTDSCPDIVLKFDRVLAVSNVISLPVLPGTVVFLNEGELNAADDAWVNVLVLIEQLQDSELPKDQAVIIQHNLEKNLSSFRDYVQQIEQSLLLR